MALTLEIFRITLMLEVAGFARIQRVWRSSELLRVQLLAKVSATALMALAVRPASASSKMSESVMSESELAGALRTA